MSKRNIIREAGWKRKILIKANRNKSDWLFVLFKIVNFSQTFHDLKSDIWYSNFQVFKTSYKIHGKLLLIYQLFCNSYFLLLCVRIWSNQSLIISISRLKLFQVSRQHLPKKHILQLSLKETLYFSTFQVQTCGPFLLQWLS